MCDVYTLVKSHRVQFPLSLNKSYVPFMLVHSDVWGLAKIPTMSGARWFVSFIDDHTRMTWVSLMKIKSEVTIMFKNFNSIVVNQFQSCIKVLWTDNAGEFVNQELKQYLDLQGIIHQTSCSYTP